MLASRQNDVVRVLAYSDSRSFSGAEVFFCRVVADLAARPRLDLSAACADDNRRLVDELARATARQPVLIRSQALRLAGLHLVRPDRLGRIDRLLAEGDWDVLLLNLPSTEYGAAPLLAPHCPPTIGLLHIHQSLEELGFRLGRVRDAAARRALRKLNTLCVLSEVAREAVSSWSDGIDVRVVPLPRPKVPFVDGASARRELDLPDGKVVGIAGRVSLRQKGHDVLVDAATLLPDVTFAVAGSGRDEARLRRLLVRKGVGDRFRLLGPVDPIWRFLAAIDAVVIPSRFEGLPLVALEAIAMGTPGVAASVDGLREVWPPGWLVLPDDAAGLAAQLRAVLDVGDTARAEALAWSRARLRERTKEDLGPSFENLILELARSNAQAARTYPSCP